MPAVSHCTNTSGATKTHTITRTQKQILRSAYETAYATAALHAGAHPEPLAMSDIVFRSPCTVGSVVEFDAKVVLTHGDLMRVAVAAVKHTPALGPAAPVAASAADGGGGGGAGGGRGGAGGGGAHPAQHAALTTTFSFLFAAPPGHRVPPVRPETLADAADWLLAARQHREDGYPLPPPLTGTWDRPAGPSGGSGGNGGGAPAAGSKAAAR